MTPRKSIPERTCANPKCDNPVVLPDGQYGRHKKFCSKKCSTRFHAKAHYERLTPEQKRAAYEAQKPQGNARQKRWGARNPVKRQESSWRCKGINLTVPQYERLYTTQQGQCAICNNERPMFGRGGLQPDHCYATGAIRGLLCVRCNTSLGVFGDTAEGLETALRYLKRKPPPL